MPWFGRGNLSYKWQKIERDGRKLCEYNAQCFPHPTYSSFRKSLDWFGSSHDGAFFDIVGWFWGIYPNLFS